MTRPVDKVQFPGADGHQLVGRLHLPVGEPEGWALFAHCFTCSKDLRAARAITQSLTDQGIATLRFDFTGLGESEGEFADTDVSSNVADLVAAAAWMRAQHQAPGLLVGHSLGGAAVILAAQYLPEVKAVATLGAPSEPVHVAEQFAGHRDTIEAEGSAVVELAGRPFRIQSSFLRDLEDHTLLACLPDLDRALLILHTPQDLTVGIEHAERLYKAARHPKSFVSLDGADHLLSRPADATYAGSVVAAWARRYLDPVARPPSAEHGDDVEVRTGDTGFATTIVTRNRHRLRADEPTSVGGTDTGPTPYELLGAALGACTSMTLRMYADRKRWPLQAITVHVRHAKVHATDCARCETPGGRIDRLERVIVLEGELDATQRQRLLEIADRCPVHRTLHSEVDVVTTLG